MFNETFEWDDSEEIHRCCQTNFIPCGALVDAAIDAHRTAWARYLSDPNSIRARTVGNALHVLLMAHPNTADEASDRLSYVRDELPAAAWQHARTGDGWSCERVRAACISEASEALARLAS